MVDIDDSIDKTKGKSDEKIYRYVTLDNGLECLLISTEHSTRIKQENNMKTIINDRRMSVRHSKIALVKTSAAKDVILGAEAEAMFPEIPKETEDHSRPPSLPKRITKPMHNHSRRRTSALKLVPNPSQRLSRSSKAISRENHTVLPSNISRISLFSELKPLSRSQTKTSMQETDVDQQMPHPVAIPASPTPANVRRRTFVRSTSMTIPGNTVISLDNARNERSRVKMAAVSMAVAVGSFAEPREYHGLAHFLEHLLFMGSTKYPEENAFDQFLSRVGGSSNAYTDSERTVYHFNCPQDDLKQALDIFAQFFISPSLISERGIRELESIEEEFKLRKNDDECLSLELWRYTARANTPFSQFTCGNKQTLKPAIDPNIFKCLREFHDKYYIGENMKLVIQTGLTMDELQNVVTNVFEPVRCSDKNRTLPLYPVFQQTGLPWKIGIPKLSKKLLERREEIWKPLIENDLNTSEVETTPPGEDGASLGCIFSTVPLQDGHKVVLLWQLPPQCDKKGSRPTDYLVSLLGNCCKGSVFDEARRRGWVTSLIATCSTTDGFEDNSVCTLFKVSISLTTQGFDQWTYVVGLVFEYLNMLRKENLQEWVFDEAVQVYKASYDYAEETDAQARVQELSVCLLPQWGYTPKNLLDMGLHSELRWSPEEIRFVLNQLRPELVRIDLSSSAFKIIGKTYKRQISRRVEEEGQLRNSVDSSVMKTKSKRSFRGAESFVSNIARFKRKIIKRSSKTSKLNNSECDIQNYTVFNRPFRRVPDIEPFTELPYWSNRIPTHVMNMWIDLLEGRITVIADVEEDSYSQTGEHSRNILSYPPRNEFIAEDFEMKKQRKDYSKRPESQFLVGKEIQIKHGPDTEPSPKTTDTGYEETNAFITGRIKYLDIERNSIIVEYENGQRKWHQLPSTFFHQHKELFETHNRQHSRTSMTDMSEQGSIPTKYLCLKVDGRHNARILNSLFQELFNPTNVEASEGDLHTTTRNRIARHSAIKNFPLFDRKDKEKVPILLSTSDALLSVWHYQDSSYSFPRAELRCRILNDKTIKSSINAALNDLLSLVITEAIRAEVYQAQVAELDVSINALEHGQAINIYGFSQRLPKVLNTVISSFVDFAQCGQELADLQLELESLGKTKNGRRYKGFEEKLKRLRKQSQEKLFSLIETPVFYAQLEALGQAYCNEGSQFQSTGVLSSAMYRVLVKNTIPPETKAIAASSIEAEPTILAVYAANFLRKCKVEILVAGNVSLDEAKNMSEAIRTMLKLANSQWLPAVDVPTYQTIDVGYSRVVPSRDSWHALSGLVHPLEALEFKGHSVDLYFHIGDNNLVSRVILELLEHLMKEPLYREVRTKQQLGYMVKCSSVKIHGKLGFVIELTSGKHLPQQLAQDIDNFLLLFRNTLRDMKNEVFSDNVSALARKKLELKSFSQAVDQHWETIQQSYEYNTLQYKWNSVFDEVLFLRDKVTLDLLIQKYDEWLMPTSEQRRRVSVVVFGNGHGINPLKELQDRKRYITIVNGSEYQDLGQSNQGPMCAIM